MSLFSARPFRRTPKHARRRVEIARAAAWQALVAAHAEHALRFVALMRADLSFGEAVSRYLDEMDLRDPMASAVRSRVFVSLNDSPSAGEDDPSALEGADPSSRDMAEPDAAIRDDRDGLHRLRPDVLVRDMARRYREQEEEDEIVALAVAQAEEGLIRTHIASAMEFAAILGEEALLDEGVKLYIDEMSLTGGRAQAVFQRTMAELADRHLPRIGWTDAAG